LTAEAPLNFMNVVPAFVRRRIAHRPHLVKIVDNMGWLFFDKVLRMGVGLLVGVWVARYLGPEQFGLLSFALAFVGMFAAVAGLGLQSIVVRDVVRDPSCKEETMGTAAVLQLLGGLLAYGSLMGTIFWLRPDDALAKLLVAILGSIMLLKFSEVALYWFESQVLSKYIVWVQNGCFLIFAVIKVGLIVSNAPLIAFAWTTAAEALMVAVLILFMLGLHGPKLQKLRFSLLRAKTLLSDSWPLLLSGMAIMVYMKIDQIMLGQMLGDDAVGIYSAAVRISEMWFFTISIVLASIFPSLAKHHANNSLKLNQIWVETYRVMFWISISVALFLTALSDLLVDLLYGVDYLGAGAVISIHVWAGVSVAIGSVWSKWLLLENRLSIGLYGHLIGVAINIILNFYLIPIYGISGAAFGTMFSYWLSALIVYSVHKPKETFGLLFQAIFFRRVDEAEGNQ